MNRKQIVNFLNEHGFEFQRFQKGSHQQYRNSVTNQIMTLSLRGDMSGRGWNNFCAEVKRKSNMLTRRENVC